LPRAATKSSGSSPNTAGRSDRRHATPGDNNSAAKPLELSFGAPVIAGHAVIVCVFTQDSGTAQVTDSQGNAYDMVVGPIA
jgi:hypothetical protein